MPQNNQPQIFSYGSIYGGLRGIVSGTLTRMVYDDDKNAIANGYKSKQVKAIIEIDPPEGMTEKDFDNAVINAAKEFEGNKEITYSLYPRKGTTGNCNTSSTTLLYKAGVSKEQLEEIKKKIPDIKWGFGDIKPWTQKEREDALLEEKKYKTFFERFVELWTF